MMGLEPRQADTYTDRPAAQSHSHSPPLFPLHYSFFPSPTTHVPHAPFCVSIALWATPFLKLHLNPSAFTTWDDLCKWPCVLGFQAPLGLSGHLDKSMVTFLKTSPCAGSDGLRTINAAAAENRSLNKRAEQLLRFLFRDEVIWVRIRESSTKKLKGVHEPLRSNS